MYKSPHNTPNSDTHSNIRFHMTITTLSTLKITNKTRRVKKHLTDLTQYTQLITVDCSRRIKSLLFPFHIAYIGVTL